MYPSPSPSSPAIPSIARVTRRALAASGHAALLGRLLLAEARGSTAGDLPGLRRLRVLHQLHHRPEEMTRTNFNLTFPLTDWLAGTLKEPTSR